MNTPHVPLQLGVTILLALAFSPVSPGQVVPATPNMSTTRTASSSNSNIKDDSRVSGGVISGSGVTSGTGAGATTGSGTINGGDRFNGGSRISSSGLRGGASFGLPAPKPQPTTVRTTAHIAFGEARQWNSADGKSLLGKLIAFEDLVAEAKQEPGTKPVPATLPAPPEKPTVIRDGKVRLLVDNKVYEVPLERLGEEDQKFVQQIKNAIDAKKTK